MKDLYYKNFKSLKKEIEDLWKCGELPGSWIGRNNIIKMAILPEPIYRFNAITIKIQIQLFTEQFSNSYETINSPRHRKLFSAVRDHQVAQWNRIEEPKYNPHTYGHLIFNNEDKTIHWKNNSIFNKDVRSIGGWHVQGCKWILSYLLVPVS